MQSTVATIPTTRINNPLKKKSTDVMMPVNIATHHTLGTEQNGTSWNSWISKAIKHQATMFKSEQMSANNAKLKLNII